MAEPSHTSPSSAPPADRMIRLADPLSPTVHLFPEDPLQAVIEPFPFPPFPLSQEGWLIGLGHHFYKFFRHGFAVLLLLDIRKRLWVKPVIPVQRCSLEGASFQVTADVLAALGPTLRIAGSFQWSAATQDDEAEAMVPLFDGLHLIYWHRSTLSRYFFLRAGRTCQRVDPEGILLDDWDAYLDCHRHRLEMP